MAPRRLRAGATSDDIAALAASVPDSGGVVVVPAFTGLGAPYWDPDARGAILGITRGTELGHIARATLEAIAHQVADVVEAMEADTGRRLKALRVDGGAAGNDVLLQIQADLLDIAIERPVVAETTALGAAYLAAWPSVTGQELPRSRPTGPSTGASSRRCRRRIGEPAAGPGRRPSIAFEAGPRNRELSRKSGLGRFGDSRYAPPRPMSRHGP